MSVYVLALSLVLTGQLADADRYGIPTGQPAVAPQSPAPAVLRGGVSPPPRFSAPETTGPATTSPATTAEDNGYGVPAARPVSPISPPATARIESTTPSNVLKPSTLMRSMLVAPTGSRLTGRPVRLSEALAGASTRQEQSQRVEAYWDLSSSVADYYLGVREQDELQRLRAGVTNVGPVWQQAASELGVRIGTSERAAIASQYRLASLMGGSAAGGLPIPTDLPHCGDYYARYDQVFAGRESSEARELSELLPMRYEELGDAAQAVTRAEEFLGAVAAQRTSGDGSGTLRALELLALRRRAFVQIARDYNRRIARYTELASPGQIDSDRLIGMLIMRESAGNTATRPANLIPPPNRQSQLPANGVDQTFAEGWESIKSAAVAVPIDDTVPRDESVKPASAEAKRSKPRREHSLLVPSE